MRGGAEPHALSVARRVPIPLQPKVKEELDRLQALGVIAAITKPINIMMYTNGASPDEIGKGPHLRRRKETQ